MGVFLTASDLAPFATIDEAKAEAMIADAEAMASLAAPCIMDPDFALHATLPGALKAILRGAIIRWNEAGSGALQQQQVGPFGQTLDTRQQRRGMFWPSEIEQLRGLCATFNGGASGAYTIDMAPTVTGPHLAWCSLHFGATYCSCGVDIAGYPLFEA